MADDSLEVQEDEVPFHPCNTPRGMTWYNLNVLTSLQQSLLNDLKVDIIRENNKYLARHPEIRALIFLFLRYVFITEPVTKTLAIIAKNFFSRPKCILQKEVEDYLMKRGEPLKKEGDSAVNTRVQSCRPSTEEDIFSYRPDYFTYLSHTDVYDVEEGSPEWSSSDFDYWKLFPSQEPSTVLNLSAYLAGIRPESQSSLGRARSIMPERLFYGSTASTLTESLEERSSLEQSTEDIAKFLISHEICHEEIIQVELPAEQELAEESVEEELAIEEELTEVEYAPEQETVEAKSSSGDVLVYTDDIVITTIDF